MPIEAVAIVIFAGLAWLWLDSIKVREAAMAAAREACAAEGVLLLDDTVAIAGLKPARNREGRIKLQRSYAFEFSDTGDNRRKGSVILLGRELILINVGVRETAQRSMP